MKFEIWGLSGSLATERESQMDNATERLWHWLDAFDAACNDLGLGMKGRRVLDERRNQERPILHQSQHGVPFSRSASRRAPLVAQPSVPLRQSGRVCQKRAVDAKPC